MNVEWVNTIVQGILTGGLYAMFAAGLSLIFGVMRLVNIAHGDLIVLAAYIALVVVETLGRDVNGVWVTIVSLTGFIGLLILGVPMAAVRFIADGVARHDVPATNRAIATCLGICLALGSGALLVGLGGRRGNALRTPLSGRRSSRSPA